MKHLLVTVLLTATVFAQTPDIILEGFSWPEQVRKEMTVRSSQQAQTIVLHEQQLAYGGYSLVDQNFHENVILPVGSKLNVWRYDLEDESYYLMQTKNGWYWVTTADLYPSQESRGPSFVIENLEWNQKFSYWSADYGDRIAGSRYSLFVDKKLSWIGNGGDFDLSPGAGFSMRYRPDSEIRSQAEQIPMYLVRLALNANKSLFQSDWLRFQWYASGSYYMPIESRFDDTWDVYSKFSWRLPTLLSSNLRLNFTYYGSEPVSKEWEYSEGKVQLLYSYENLPIYIGWVPYTSANWRNTDGWVTHSEAKDNNFVIGVESSKVWFELNFGTYHKKSGMEPEISHEGDERHLSFSVGTKR
ncbi:MAG: hypothetical protein ACKKL6_00825 [Candidatus Komeilibacteria bacterium]